MEGYKKSPNNRLVLVGEPDVMLAWQAEELLHWVAGDQAPEAKVGAGSVEARRRCRAAWEAWCKEHAGGVDLSALRRQSRIPVLIAVQRQDGDVARGAKGTPELAILGCDGRARWKRPLLQPAGFQW